jgi:DNA replication protein DnaC
MAGHGDKRTPESLSAILGFNQPKKTPQEIKRLKEERAAIESQEVRADISRRLGSLLGDCGQRLDPFNVCKIDNFEEYDPAMAETVGAIRGYIGSLEERIADGDSIFLIGPPGTGKDHLAIAVAREAVIRLGKTARWLDASKFRSELRDAIKSTRDEKRTFAPYLGAGVLVFSDPVAIGSKLSDYQADCFFRIIDGRYRAKRPTFVTSNVKSQAEAESLLGSQVVDRLSHGGLRLRCSWESYRGRN